jgi:hypothetical protein
MGLVWQGEIVDVQDNGDFFDHDAVRRYDQIPGVSSGNSVLRYKDIHPDGLVHVGFNRERRAAQTLWSLEGYQGNRQPTTPVIRRGRRFNGPSAFRCMVNEIPVKDSKKLYPLAPVVEGVIFRLAPDWTDWTVKSASPLALATVALTIAEGSCPRILDNEAVTV